MADIDITHPAITDLEKESFEDLCRYIKNDEVALMRVNYQGVPRVVIAFMFGERTAVGSADLWAPGGQSEHVDIIPLAMILNDEMFHNIIPLPGGETVEVKA